MRFDPQTAAAVAASAGIGWMMIIAGVGKSALEWRRRRRVCPSCGRDTRACVC